MQFVLMEDVIFPETIVIRKRAIKEVMSIAISVNLIDPYSILTVIKFVKLEKTCHEMQSFRSRCSIFKARRWSLRTIGCEEYSSLNWMAICIYTVTDDVEWQADAGCVDQGQGRRILKINGFWAQRPDWCMLIGIVKLNTSDLRFVLSTNTLIDWAMFYS